MAYGDGLFETIAVRAGRPSLLTQHLDRLALGCQRLAIEADLPLIRDEIIAYASQLGEGVAKLILTRGDSLRGYAPAAGAAPRRILQGSPLPAYPRENAEHGIRLFDCQTRLAEQPLLAGLKHLNRLEQVLARSEWQGTDHAEGLMRDMQGRLIEGCTATCSRARRCAADGGPEPLRCRGRDACGVARAGRSTRCPDPGARPRVGGVGAG